MPSHAAAAARVRPTSAARAASSSAHGATHAHLPAVISALLRGVSLAGARVSVFFPREGPSAAIKSKHMSESTEEGDWYDGRVTQFRVGIAAHNMAVLGVCVRYDYDGSTEWVRMPHASSPYSEVDAAHDCAENVRFRIATRVVTHSDGSPALAFVHSHPDLDAPPAAEQGGQGGIHATPVRVLDLDSNSLVWTQMGDVHPFAAPACSSITPSAVRAYGELRALHTCRAAAAAAVHARMIREGHGLCACVIDPTCPLARAAALFSPSSRAVVRKEKAPGAAGRGETAPMFAAHEWFHVDVTSVVSVAARVATVLTRDAGEIASAAPPGVTLASVTTQRAPSLAQPATPAATTAGGTQKRPTGKGGKAAMEAAATTPASASPLDGLTSLPALQPAPFSGDIVGAFVCMWVYGHATHILCEETDATAFLSREMLTTRSVFASTLTTLPGEDVHECVALPWQDIQDAPALPAHLATAATALQACSSLWGHPVVAWIARYSIHTRRHLCVFESPAQLQARLAAVMSGDADAVRTLQEQDTAAADAATPRVIRMAWLDLARVGAIVLPRAPALQVDTFAHAPQRPLADAGIPRACVMCLGYEALPSLCCSSSGGCGGRRIHGACMDPPHTQASSLPRSVMDEYAAPHANAFLDVASILAPPAAVKGDDGRAHTWLCALCRACDNCGSRNADGEPTPPPAAPATHGSATVAIDDALLLLSASEAAAAPAPPVPAAAAEPQPVPTAEPQPVPTAEPQPVATAEPPVASFDARTSFMAICASLDERGSHLGRANAADVTAASMSAPAASAGGSGHWVLHSYVPVPGTRVYDTRRRAALSGDVAHAHSSVSPSEPVILLLCVKCGGRCAAGHYCPVCHLCYADDSISMVACDACWSWIHTACDGLGMEDLTLMEAGTHPVWGSRYTCPLCRHRLMVEVMHALRATEGCAYFTMPVGVKDAPGYHAIITQPMDLWTLSCNLDAGVYDMTGAAGTAAFRAHVELIARNALTFNTPQDGVYAAAWKFQKAAAAIFALKLPMTSDVAFRDEFERLRVAEAAQARVSARGHPHRGGRGGVKRARQTEEVSPRPARKGLPQEHVWPKVTAPAIHVPRVPTGELWVFPPSTASLDLCVLCGGSHSSQAMIFCTDCGTPFHLACVDATVFRRCVAVAERIIASSLARGCVIDDAVAEEPPCALLRDAVDSVALDGSDAHVHVHGITTTYLRDVLHSRALAAVLARMQAVWRCDDCVVCDACGVSLTRASPRVRACFRCAAVLHVYCATPPVSVGPGEQWYCARCVDCTGCGHSSSWSTRIDACASCTAVAHAPALPTLLTARGDAVDAARTAAVVDSCPVCLEAWDAADTTLVQCDVCSGWVHGNCDPVFIGTHTRAVLAELDSAARYICKMCRCSSVSMCMDAARACVERCVSVRAHIRSLLMTQRMAHGVAALAEHANLLAAPAAASTAQPVTNVAYAAARVRARVSRDYASPLRAVKRHTHAVHIIGLAPAWLRAYEDARVIQVRTNMRAAVRTRGSGSSFPLSPAFVVKAAFAAHSLSRSLQARLCGAADAHVDVVTGTDVDMAPEQALPSQASIPAEESGLQEPTSTLPIPTPSLERDDRVCALCGVAGNCASGLAAADAFAASRQGASALRMVTSIAQSLIGTAAAPSRADSAAYVHSRRGMDAQSHAAQQRSAARDRLRGCVAEHAAELFTGLEGPLLALHVPISRGSGDAPLLTAAVHAQCALWSSDALVDDGGVLYSVYNILRRAVRTHCSHCGGVGASLHCCGRGCSSVFHLRCALVAGSHLTIQHACYCMQHMRECDDTSAIAHAHDALAAEVARTLTRADAPFPAADEVVLAYVSARAHARALLYVNTVCALRVAEEEGAHAGARVLPLAPHTALFMPSRTPAVNMYPWAFIEQDASGASGDATPVSRQDVSPSTPAALLTDIVQLHPAGRDAFTVPDVGHERPLLRVGSCTVLEWGAIDTHTAGVHTEAHIIPCGWRAQRRAWRVSPSGQLMRGTYTVRVLADVSAAADGMLWQHRKLVFSIVCDDDATLQVADTCPHACLRRLRAALDLRAGHTVFLSREEAAVQRRDSALLHATASDAPLSRLRWYPLLQLAPAAVPFPDDTLECVPAPSHDSVPVDVCVHGDAFTLNAHVWFGYGLPSVQARLEAHASAPLTAITPAGSAAQWPRHIFRYVQTSSDAIADARAAREAASAQRRVNEAGCARMIVYDRTERNHAHKTLAYLAARASGVTQPPLLEMDRVVMGGGGGAAAAMGGSEESQLVAASRARHDELRAPPTSTAVVHTAAHERGSAAAPGGPDDGSMVVADARLASAFRVMKSIPLWDRICVRRSRIHGWGLFVKVDVPQDGVVIEYTGQLVRTPTADRREIVYEEAHRVGSLSGAVQGQHAVQGVYTPDASRLDAITMLGTPVGTRISDGSGSCYLFRLDDEWIIDATMKGSAARFMNHCCDPNCYSKAVLVDGEKHIVILAMRELKVGEEVTYNYKFAFEADPAQKIPCYCGAPSCVGTMN